MNHFHNIFSMISPAEYADVSVLAQQVGENMLSRLELVTLQPKIILDVGCGAGYCATLLQQHYPEASVIALDQEEKMLRYMQSFYQGDLVCADTARLPLQTASVDMIFANLLLPWCYDWEVVLHEWRRVLRPEGLLIFSCLGPDTLREIPENNLHLKDMHELGDTLVHAKFSDPVMDMEYLTMTYREKDKLFYELQMNGLIKPGTVFPIEKNANDLFQMTYEVIYGHTWGPSEQSGFTADDEGIIKVPLSFLRNRGKKSNPYE